jgi:recombination protein RecA
MKAKWAALDLVNEQINKQFKTESAIVRLGSRVGKDMPSISTGCPSWDYEVFGCGGAPRGRIIELIGPESCGKTTILEHIIAQEQKKGNLAALVDAEHAFDPNYAAKLGVNVDDLVISQPDSGEQALETVEALVKSGAVSIIGVDSVAALVPQAELDGEMGDSHMGLQARLMSQACRKLRGIVRQYDVTLIFINQIREKIGVMFGSPETGTGGRALRFYASTRLDIRRIADIKEDDVVIGHTMKIKGVKNKVGPPKRECEIDLIYGIGLDQESDLLTYGVKLGVVEKSGAWYNCSGERVGQGLRKAAANLRDNPEWTEKIRKIVNDARIARNIKEAQKD